MSGGSDVQAAMAEYKVQRQSELAAELAFEIADKLDGEIEITKGAVMAALVDFNKESKEKIYPRIEQVVQELKDWKVNVVEETATKVENVCDEEGLCEGAATQIIRLLQSESDSGKTALEALQEKSIQIQKLVKTLKPSGRMLSADLVWSKMLEAQPTLNQNAETERVFKKILQG